MEQVSPEAAVSTEGTEVLKNVCRSYHGGCGVLMHVKEPIAEIHRYTTTEHGIKDDNWMWIENTRGKIRQKANVTEGIDPRLIHPQFGWWFPEEPAPEYGACKSNANVSTSVQPPFDQQMGTYHLRGLFCRVARYEGEGGA